MTRILISNDDGLSATGIQALTEAVTDAFPAASVYVCAPDSERSASGHSITTLYPLVVFPAELDAPVAGAWSTNGTPVDCVKVAIEALLPEPPDIVISGINHGANLGTDVFYSGTVSAAREGSILGVNALAVSLCGSAEQMLSGADAFAPAAEAAVRVARRMLTEDWPTPSLFSLNVPSDWNGQISLSRLGVRSYSNVFEQRTDPRGRTYFWLGGEPVDDGQPADTDLAAVGRGEASLTPLSQDATCHECLNRLAGVVV